MSEDNGAEEYKKKGNEAFKAGDWDEAIKNYNKAITLDPKQAAFYSNRAACWSNKGKHDSALSDAKQCLEIDPAFIKGYSRKGKALFDLQKWKEAEEAYNEGLKVDPTNAACQSGLQDTKNARAQSSRPRSSSSGGGGIFGQIMGKLNSFKRQGGIGGRLQMYMVVFAGYYLYKNYANPNKTPEVEDSPDESMGASMDNDEVIASLPGSLQRGFSEVAGQWSGFLEASGESQTRLVFLHRTASSAEAEFGETVPRLLKKAASSSVGLQVFAPDRPCHGYTPCLSSGSDSKWLQGLLKTRPAKRWAYVASGKEAVHTVLELIRQRKDPAHVLLLSPRAQQSTGAQSDLAAAEALRWAALTKGSSSGTSDELDVMELPEGSSVTILTAAGEAEHKSLEEDLDKQGLSVRSRKLTEADDLSEELAAEVLQMLQDA